MLIKKTTLKRYTELLKKRAKLIQAIAEHEGRAYQAMRHYYAEAHLTISEELDKLLSGTTTIEELEAAEVEREEELDAILRYQSDGGAIHTVE